MRVKSIGPWSNRLGAVKLACEMARNCLGKIQGVGMLINRRIATAGMLSLLTGSSITTLAHAAVGELNLGEGLEDFWLATDAYIYGYPLVTVELSRRRRTHAVRLH